MNGRKVYLGDGVYYRRSDYGVELTAENGISVQHEIALEPPVLQCLVRQLVTDFGKAAMLKLVSMQPDQAE